MKTRQVYTVRLVRADDINAYFRLMKDNQKYLEGFFTETLPSIKTWEDTIIHLAHSIQEAERKNRFLFVIEDHRSGRLIGSVQVKHIDQLTRKAEIGYYLDRRSNGNDILSKAVGQVVDFCFYSQNLSKLLYRTSDANMPGRRVAESNGFTFDGVMNIHLECEGGTVSHVMQYSLVNPGIQ